MCMVGWVVGTVTLARKHALKSVENLFSISSEQNSCLTAGCSWFISVYIKFTITNLMKNDTWNDTKDRGKATIWIELPNKVVLFNFCLKKHCLNKYLI